MVKPPLRQLPPQPRAETWWTQPQYQPRDKFDAKADERAREVAASEGTQHIQRREGDK